MAFWFASNRFVDGDLQGLIALGGAERCTQIGSVILAQAHVKRARTGEPDAVTAFAEVMGEGRYESELATGLTNLNIASRTAGPVGNVCQRPVLLKPLSDGRQRKVLVDTVAANITHVVQRGPDQGKAAGSMIAGKPEAYDAVPRFWSDQYDAKLQIVGLSAPMVSNVLQRYPTPRALCEAFELNARACAARDSPRPRRGRGRAPPGRRAPRPFVPAPPCAPSRPTPTCAARPPAGGAATCRRCGRPVK